MTSRHGGRIPPAPRRFLQRSEHDPRLPLRRCRPARSTRFPTSPAPASDSKELADRLLNEAGVACLSGTSFGEHGEGYLRFSYANSLRESDGSRRAHPQVSRVALITGICSGIRSGETPAAHRSHRAAGTSPRTAAVTALPPGRDRRTRPSRNSDRLLPGAKAADSA